MLPMISAGGLQSGLYNMQQMQGGLDIYMCANKGKRPYFPYYNI